MRLASAIDPPAGAIGIVPAKRTCTPAEAAEALGCSVRLVNYWIADGTLLALDLSRRGPESDPGRRHYRVVVRRAVGVPGAGRAKTLEEFVNERRTV
jgi:hypothetical protein